MEADLAVELEHAVSQVHPAHRVYMSEATAWVGMPGQAPPAEPLVTLIRNGDHVQAIEVTCTCGKTIRMNCEF